MPIKDISNTRTKEEKIFSEVKRHQETGFQETDNRATGKGRIGSISFNEADELFRSWLDEACVLPDTEVLTLDGYKFITEITENDSVLSLNPETKKAEYITGNRLVSFEHDGPMVHFSGRSIDLITNNNHRVWSASRHDKENFTISQADSFLDKNPNNVVFNNKINLVDNDKKVFEIPKVKTKRFAKNQVVFDAEVFAIFLGWYLTEGCSTVAAYTSGKVYRVDIAQTKKPGRKIIIATIKKLGFTPTIKSTVISFSALSLATWLKRFGLSYQKFVPREIMDYPKKVLKNLLFSLIGGDGQWLGDSRWRFTTTSRRLADDVQELALKVGFKASIASNKWKTPNGRKVYRVSGSILDSGNLHAKEIKKIENYIGSVHSLVMPKNKIYMARRKGKCVWTGNTWPYDALLFDPRVFTFIFEKTSRLISSKPKAVLTPRKDSDELSARVNNSLLSYQWDMATIGGTMLSKWALMDINARKYGASFAVAKWRYETDNKGGVVYDGPEMQVLNNRDIAHDLSATSIESCNWFQSRTYTTVQDLENVNDASRSGPVYKNLKKLKFEVKRESNEGTTTGGDSRSVNWVSRNRAIAGLEADPIGKDEVFKTVEIITEYRRDRWITFAEKHGVVLRDIANPYNNYELPIVMLRYYQIDDDLYGTSEIEPVKGLQKAINALLCQYVDEINQKLYSPIAIGPGVRQHTLEWGKGARWIMNNPMTDFRLVESRSNAAQFFNNTYSVLVAAMMNALGESSLGISNIQPYQKDKTATEVKALQLQRNARDQYNQSFLGEAIKRQYLLWHQMNQVLLFSDKNASHFAIRVAGRDALKYFENKDLGAFELPNEVAEIAFDLERENKKGKEDFEQYSLPKHPINIGTKKKPEIVPKLGLEKGATTANLYVEPIDIRGMYDFTIDVESMAINSDEERKQGRQAAVSMLATNPNIIQLLATENVKPRFKDLFIQWLEDLGFYDAERFFEEGTGGSPMPMPGAGGGAPGAGPTGIPGGTNPNAGGETPSQTPFTNPIAPNEGLGRISPKSLG